MKIIICLAFMVVFFSGQHLILRMIGPKVSPIVIILGHVIILTCAAITIVAWEKGLDRRLSWPVTKNEWMLIGLQAFFVFGGLVSMLIAYGAKASPVTVSTWGALVPIILFAVSILHHQEKFELHRLIGCILAAIAVALVTHTTKEGVTVQSPTEDQHVERIE